MKRLCFTLSVFAVAGSALSGEIALSDLDLTKASQGYKRPRVDSSISSAPLKIGGKEYARGVGSHAPGKIYIQLDGKAEKFEVLAGVDDGAGGRGSVQFQVLTDGVVVFDSGVKSGGAGASKISVNLAGVKMLLLRLRDGRDGSQFDHADWVDGKITYSGEAPVTVGNVAEKPYMLTPKPGNPPVINAPAIYGCGPGNDFLYRIPVTGLRPLEFKCENLPAGLKLDAQTGIIAGTSPARGDYPVHLTVSNSAGQSSHTLTIRSGDDLALTPYMGWNHWYAYYENISDARMRQAADSLIESGMADFGYNYVCIDDCWARKPGSDNPALQGEGRDANGMILPNKNFPDMAALTSYIHGKGLKAGIYTSPGPLTCTSYNGSFSFEAQDAQQYAEWEFDLLKHDWCSYGRNLGKIFTGARDERVKPYQLMGDLLRQQKRDIVYNLCQYGQGQVWEWGPQVHAQSWRTSGDLGFELTNFIPVAYENAKHRAWSKPGHWNDPDYLLLGNIGKHHGEADELVPCPLTPTEQYSYMSLWCLMAAPLVYSGDIAQIDEFTLNVLCNAEVIAINQDELGQSGALTDLQEDCFMLAKTMADGSLAVGLVNGRETTSTLTANWAALGINGDQVVRDVWRQKDIGTHKDSFTADVPRHGTKLLRLSAANR